MQMSFTSLLSIRRNLKRTIPTNIYPTVTIIMATWIIQNMSTEARKNMETIRINIKNIMLGMITAGTVGMTTAGIVGMTTIITVTLRNFS